MKEILRSGLTEVILVEDAEFLPYYFDGLVERRRQIAALYIKSGNKNPFLFDISV